MAKVQTRRNISLSRGTFERIKAHCEREKIPMSQFIQHIIISETPEYCAATHYLEHGHMPDGNEEYTGRDEDYES